jgi:hypothetical protein
LKANDQEPTPLSWSIGTAPDQESDPLGTTVRGSTRPGDFYGQTPEPTPEDGWLVTGRIVPTESGLAIHELKIEPTWWIWEDGKRRPRDDSEYEVDINSSVLKLINLTEIRNSQREFYAEAAATTAGGHWPKGLHERYERLANMPPPRRRPVNTPDYLYECAQDVLVETSGGPGIRSRLGRRWGVSKETVKSRLRRLRAEGWISGDSRKAMPGPTYMSHAQPSRGKGRIEIGKDGAATVDYTEAESGDPSKRQPTKQEPRSDHR